MPPSPRGLRERFHFSGSSAHYPKSVEGEIGFSLCAFIFPGLVSHGKAALWLSVQAQGRDPVCTQDRVSAVILAGWRESVLWLFFTCSRLKRASL